MSQLKIKNGNSWESIPAGGIGVPSGGSSGDVLVKSSSTDYATEWQTPEVKELLLYDAGNEYSAITGGWTFKNTSSKSTASGSGSKETRYLYIKNIAYSSWCACTTNQIDLTDFNYIEVLFATSGVSDVSGIYVASSFPSLPSSYARKSMIVGRIGDLECPVPYYMSIADLSGNYYIAIQAFLSDCRVYRVRLLK